MGGGGNHVEAANGTCIEFGNNLIYITNNRVTAARG